MNHVETFTSVLTKAKNAYSTGGIFLLLKRAIKRVYSSLFDMNNAFWFERDLNAPIEKLAPKVPVQIDWHSGDETLEWVKQQRTHGYISPQQLEEIAVATAGKHYLPSARYNGKIVGYVKVGFGDVYIEDFEKILHFPEGVAFIYDTYVKPDMRGLGIAPFLVTGIMVFLKERGFMKLMCHIPPWNSASMRAYTKCSFRMAKRIWYFKIFGCKLFSTNLMNPLHIMRHPLRALYVS